MTLREKLDWVWDMVQGVVIGVLILCALAYVWSR